MSSGTKRCATPGCTPTFFIGYSHLDCFEHRHEKFPPFGRFLGFFSIQGSFLRSVKIGGENLTGYSMVLLSLGSTLLLFMLHRSGMKSDPAMFLHSDHLGLITCTATKAQGVWTLWVVLSRSGCGSRLFHGKPIWKWLCAITTSYARRKTVFLSKIWTDSAKISGGGTGLTSKQVVHHVLWLSPR